jgi:hypothetical protein
VSLACGHLPDSAVAVLAQKEVVVVTALQHLHWAALGLAKTQEPEVVVVQVAPRVSQLGCAHRSREALGSSPLCISCRS